MSLASITDRFEIVSGPEDGTEFPILRVPFDIGLDPACAVNIRLDQAVEPMHAQVTVVSEGYRIRSMGGGKLWVNGKRVGTVRSRIARNGDVLKAGNTELCLVTAADGLASRSHGVATESDGAWVLRYLVKGLGYTIKQFALHVRLLWRSIRYFSGAWIVKLLIFAGVVGGLGYFFPGFLPWATNVLRNLFGWIQGTIESIF